MKEQRGRRWNVTPKDFPVGLRVVEEQSAGAIADGVDFRTKRVVASLPLTDRYNEERIVGCDVHLNDGAVFDGRHMWKPTGYYLTLENLQLAREAAGREPLTQQELDELKSQREQRGFKEVEISFPRIRIPTRQSVIEPNRKGLLARAIDALSR